jgi:hypothetical protein
MRCPSHVHDAPVPLCPFMPPCLCLIFVLPGEVIEGFVTIWPGTRNESSWRQSPQDSLLGVGAGTAHRISARCAFPQPPSAPHAAWTLGRAASESTAGASSFEAGRSGVHSGLTAPPQSPDVQVTNNLAIRRAMTSPGGSVPAGERRRKCAGLGPASDESSFFFLQLFRL